MKKKFHKIELCKELNSTYEDISFLSRLKKNLKSFVFFSSYINYCNILTRPELLKKKMTLRNMFNLTICYIYNLSFWSILKKIWQ